MAMGKWGRCFRMVGMDCYGWGSVLSCGWGLGMWLSFGASTVGWEGLLEDVEVDGSGMLPDPVVMFTCGLYDVTAWGRSLVDDCSRHVFIFCWRQNNTSWLGFSCFRSLALWGLLKFCLWLCFLYSRKLQIPFMSTGVEGSLGCRKVLLCRSPWEKARHAGLNGGGKEVKEKLFKWLARFLCCVQLGLYDPNQSLNKAIGPGKVGGRGTVVYMVVLEEFGEPIWCEWSVIVSVYQAWWSILWDELLQVLS